jgi:hypothetical protein
VLVVHGRGEAELAVPVADAVPTGLRTVYASDLGAHGSSILVEDGGVWVSVLGFLDRLATKPESR